MSCLIYIPVNILRRTNKRYSILFYSKINVVLFFIFGDELNVLWSE
jgi:hypothetical protein